jgi:hypothetical protein
MVFFEGEKMENEERNDSEELVTDLPLSEPQAEATKGGPMNFGKIEFEYKPQKPDGTLN